MMNNSSRIEMIIYESGGHQLVQELGLQTGEDALKYLYEILKMMMNNLKVICLFFIMIALIVFAK